MTAMPAVASEPIRTASKPVWWLAQQRELEAEYADMDRYYAEIDALDARRG